MRCFAANAQLGWKPDGTRETEVAPLWQADWRLEAPSIVSFLKLPEDKEAWKVQPAQNDVFAWQQVLGWFIPSQARSTPPSVLRPMRDLNGDGAEDLIWIAPRLAHPEHANGPGWFTPKEAVLVAASGKDGQPLWWFRPQHEGSTALLMADPVWAKDNVLACVLRSVNSPKKWLEAIDARTGESLWRFDVPHASGTIHQPLLFWASVESVSPRGETSRPFVAAAVSRFLVAVDVESGKPLWEPHDLGEGLGRPPRFADLDGDGSPEVLATMLPSGGKWQLTAISLTDRKPLWSTPVTWFPESSAADWPEVVDLDEDGRGEVLLPNNESRSETYGTGVRVLDGLTGKLRWSRWFPNSPHQRRRTQRKAEQYAVGPDLDGDGQRELFRASIHSEYRPRLATESHSHHYEEHMLFVDAFSGRDGRSLWWQRVPLGLTDYAAMTGTIGEMLCWQSSRHVPRDEPSGTPSRTSREASESQTTKAHHAERDGYTDGDKLVIPVHRHPDTQADGGTHSIYVLSAATGRVEHHADDLAFPQLVDWNDDGLDDLAVFAPDDPVRFMQQHHYPIQASGKFVVLRGSPPEGFRRLDRWIEEQDFDGDGIAELSRPIGGMGMDYAVQIASGRDGRIISRWKTEWPETPRSHTVGERHSFPPPLGDFDGDGRADLLVVRSEHFWEWEDDPSQIVKTGQVPLLIQAISSRTGKRAWGGGLLSLPEAFRPTDANKNSASWQAHRGNQVTVNWLDAVDLDGDQRPELLIALRLSGERFECPPPVLPEKLGFASAEVRLAQTELADHDRFHAERERIGPVNLVAAQELEELEVTQAISRAESAELSQAINQLRGSIGSLNREGRQRLLAAFEAVDGHFRRLFTTLFNGGQAHLELIDSDDPLEAGLEIMAQPPGKKLAALTLLSGGEQALTAVALIFGLFLTNPAPICVLDEVDAPLDDANVERFCDLLDAMVAQTNTRYLIVTHNAVSMARMHRLFGVTMVERGVSRLVSVNLQSAEALLAAE
jgi:outer membrane protein assembly factor BamB